MSLRRRQAHALYDARADSNLLFCKMTSAEPGRKAPYSRDIRWRVVWQRIGMLLPFKKIASNLNIAASTAYLHYKRFEITGDVCHTSQPHRESIRKLNSRCELFIIGLLLANPTMYLREVCHQVEEVFQKSISPPSICRLLMRYGMTRKKVQQVASQRSVYNRAAFLAQMTCYSSYQFVWVDEMGCDRRDHIRRFGYAIRVETLATYTVDAAFRL